MIGSVIRGLIHEHKNMPVFVVLRDTVHKNLHTFRICIRHAKTLDNSLGRRDCRITIFIFPNNLERDSGAYALWAPAGLGLIDTAKASFILKQYKEIVMFFLLFFDLLNNFFYMPPARRDRLWGAVFVVLLFANRDGLTRNISANLILHVLQPPHMLF